VRILPLVKRPKRDAKQGYTDDVLFLNLINSIFFLLFHNIRGKAGDKAVSCVLNALKSKAVLQSD